MLDTYGLHELVWDACDERFGDIAREQYDGLCPCGLLCTHAYRNPRGAWRDRPCRARAHPVCLDARPDLLIEARSREGAVVLP